VLGKCGSECDGIQWIWEDCKSSLSMGCGTVDCSNVFGINRWGWGIRCILM